MLIQQLQLTDDHCFQGQQLRALEALHRHLHPLLKEVLEQAVEGLMA
jgi:hypothetical protein